MAYYTDISRRATSCGRQYPACLVPVEQRFRCLELPIFVACTDMAERISIRYTRLYGYVWAICGVRLMPAVQLENMRRTNLRLQNSPHIKTTAKNLVELCSTRSSQHIFLYVHILVWQCSVLLSSCSNCCRRVERRVTALAIGLCSGSILCTQAIDQTLCTFLASCPSEMLPRRRFTGEG